MTRASDVFVPLDERVKIARDAGAALFISIHADTIGDEPGVSGATVYTGAEKASDRQAARVAEAENRADAVAGHEAGEDDSGVNDILFDLTRRETRAFSHVFARALVGRLKDASRLNKNPHRSAGFRVLKAPDVPAVLLELGYLSNEKDLPNLVAPEWRKKVADSMVRAVDEFFRARDGKSPRAESDLELERGVDDRQTNVVVGAQQ
jgi:N-acetylmuramoyl-L-alanine amidase